MTIVRWMDPFRELSTIQERMNQLFEDFVGRTRGGREGELAISGWAPSVDISETDNEFIVSVELPGLEKDQIGVEYKDGILTLRGERKQEREVKEESYHRMERSYGAFHRSFTLPGSVDGEKISATMKNGVLEVRLPKKEAAKPKQIKVAA